MELLALILRLLQINNPRNNGYAERVFNICCYLSMQFKDDLESEYKLSLFIAKLLSAFDEIPLMINLIKALSYRFISGHFMSLSAVNNHLSKIMTNANEQEESAS